VGRDEAEELGRLHIVNGGCGTTVAPDPGDHPELVPGPEPAAVTVPVRISGRHPGLYRETFVLADRLPVGVVSHGPEIVASFDWHEVLGIHDIGSVCPGFSVIWVKGPERGYAVRTDSSPADLKALLR
jgi:hypothetical protein